MEEVNTFPNDGAVTIKDVAAYLKVSTRTVRNWWDSNPEFPRARKIGRQTRWEAKEVRDWWQNQ